MLKLPKFYSDRREEAAQRPKSEFVPKTLSDLATEDYGKCDHTS